MRAKRPRRRVARPPLLAPVLEGPEAPPEPIIDTAAQVRALLAKAGLTQVAASRALDINERTMRYYVAGNKVPRYMILALERLVAMGEEEEV